MHFEILVEDRSCEKIVSILVPRIIGNGHSVKPVCFKGIGHLPKNLYHKPDPGKQLLLHRLPGLLRAYGKTFSSYAQAPDNPGAVVIVVCDLDNRDKTQFRRELDAVLNHCHPRPAAYFCFAIEECEAWLLGDIPAIKSAYPHARDGVLNGYVNDAICGTWELLANAIYKGGVTALKSQGGQAVGREKLKWAENICPYMDVQKNQSPSFCYFRDTLQGLAKQ